MDAVTFREMKKFISFYWQEGMKTLDVGSWQKANHKCFRELIPSNYTGIDIQSGLNVDIVVEPYHWLFEDENFDIVISGGTFEHTERFWDIAKEMARVLKTGGMMCIIAPSTKTKIHKYPIDCWRFFPDGMKVIADYANIKLLDSYLEPNECIGIFKKV